MQWICDRAVERAKQYNIEGVDYNKTMGVVKNIIPAIASTNAIVSAACVSEVIKIMTNCNNVLDNYMQYLGQTSVNTHTFNAERHHDCPVCGLQKIMTIKCNRNDLFKDIYAQIVRENELEKPPAVNAYPSNEIVYSPVEPFATFHAARLDK